MDAPTPWDDLPPYESERIAGLPFDDMIAALFDHAPKASAGDVLALLGNDFTKREVRDARDKWKAARKGKVDEVFVPKAPAREAILSEIANAIALKSAKDVERWARSLVALGRAGDVDAEPETTEEWDRLNDLEAGVLVALTRKLNGEALTTADESWLARLR